MNDVLSTAFCYAGYTTSMEELTNLGKENSLYLPSLANKYLKRWKQRAFSYLYRSVYEKFFTYYT